MSNQTVSSTIPVTFAPGAGAIQQITPGLSCEWLHDGKMIVLTIRDAKPVTVDAWVNLLMKIEDKWAFNKALLVAIDVSDKKVTLTPYARMRVNELSRHRPELVGFVAVIIPRTFAGQLMRLFVGARRRNLVEAQVFFSREDGLAWLKGKL